ncbi:MAG TPA: hypothetical protein VJH97_00340 [Candidatus Nanoarchaeia archaeon]|nr:hypothetical protein [Candidatus Nanoarchaeia archaeon]
MGLEEVKKDIIEKAVKEVMRINSETEKQVQTIGKAAADHIKAEKEKAKIHFKKEADRLTRIKTAEATSTTEQILLAAKQKLIHEAVEKAKHQLRATDYPVKLLQKAQAELDVARVYCNPHDAKHIKGIEVVTRDLDGGIIAENKDGTVSVDYSYTTLLDVLKGKYLAEIAEVLF